MCHVSPGSKIRHQTGVMLLFYRFDEAVIATEGDSNGERDTLDHDTSIPSTASWPSPVSPISFIYLYLQLCVCEEEKKIDRISMEALGGEEGRDQRN